jgi:hypothetical protein
MRGLKPLLFRSAAGPALADLLQALLGLRGLVTVAGGGALSPLEPRLQAVGLLRVGLGLARSCREA